MELLLVDHYDSFTWNLAHQLESALGHRPRVVAHDRLRPGDLEAAQAIVLSPGPGHPGQRGDFRLGLDGLRALAHLPVLGVCLGHQAMALAAGAKVDRAPRPVHGEIEAVRHDGSALFAGLPNPFEVARYHSLAVRGELPSPLRPTAWSEDGVLMALEWPGRPWWGVQFHPESIGTPTGSRLVANFLNLARSYRGGVVEKKGRERAPSAVSRSASSEAESSKAESSEIAPIETAALPSSSLPLKHPPASPSRPPLTMPRKAAPRLWARPLVLPADEQWPARAFPVVEREARGLGFGTFWLDSALAGGVGEGTWSYLGAGRGCVSYRVGGEVEVRTAEGTERAAGPLLPWLGQFLGAVAPVVTADPPPFPFRGGLVGYLGYEMRAEGVDGAGGWVGSVGPTTTAPTAGSAPSTLAAAPPRSSPDAAFCLAHRFLAFDSREGRLWAAAVVSEGESSADARLWIDSIEMQLRQAPAPTPLKDPPDPARADVTNGPVASSPGPRSPAFRLRRSPETYLRDIEASLEAIARGDSYELCLTDRLTAHCPGLDPFLTYRWLRRFNPAPYGAWLDLRTALPGGPVVASSSPERFLRLTADGAVSAKPIKGTRGRGRTPAADAAAREDLATHAKDRAENLMIVDLLRNDLGRVAVVDSVEVPKLMEVETYATVHQLVSTVTARLDPRLGIEDLLAATFPGGSMTGAPKRRTMEILETLEGAPRGIYSGALGWLGYGSGRPDSSPRDEDEGADRGGAELSIIIRAAIFEGETVSIGAGGAIVARSEPQAELEEMLLKARPVIDAVGRALLGIVLASESRD